MMPLSASAIAVAELIGAPSTAVITSPVEISRPALDSCAVAVVVDNTQAEEGGRPDMNGG